MRERSAFGPGRPTRSPAILGVRELTREEVLTVERRNAPAIKTLRDSHHMVARLFAMGLRQNEIAAKTGYSLLRITVLKQDPAFQELVASYREMVNQDWRDAVDEYFENAVAVRTTSLRLIRDKLEDAEPGDIPLNQLVAIHADTADRTGYPKRKESVNLNVDFAARLDSAIKRSSQAKVIDSVPLTSRALESPTEPLPKPAQPDGAVGAATATRASPPVAQSPSAFAKFLPKPKLERRFG